MWSRDPSLDLSSAGGGGASDCCCGASVCLVPETSRRPAVLAIRGWVVCVGVTVLASACWLIAVCASFEPAGLAGSLLERSSSHGAW